MFPQFRVSPFTTWLKQQQFAVIVILLSHTSASSRKADWILSEWPLPALSCLLFSRVSSLMNALEGKWFCLREIFINVNKFFTLLLLCVYIAYVVLAVLLLLVYKQYSLCRILVLLPYFCLFVDDVNKSIVLFLEYLFIISIFGTIIFIYYVSRFFSSIYQSQ